MPAVDESGVRKQRLDIYLSFLGPAANATPDDIEVMELIQKTARPSRRKLSWIASRGMSREQPAGDRRSAECAVLARLGAP